MKNGHGIAVCCKFLDRDISQSQSAGRAEPARVASFLSAKTAQKSAGSRIGPSWPTLAALCGFSCFFLVHLQSLDKSFAPKLQSYDNIQNYMNPPSRPKKPPAQPEIATQIIKDLKSFQFLNL